MCAPLWCGFTPSAFLFMNSTTAFECDCAFFSVPGQVDCPDSGIVELSELELGAIQGGGWFKRAFGVSTPGFLKRLDDEVRENIPGGWETVLKIAVSVYGGGGAAAAAGLKINAV